MLIIFIINFLLFYHHNKILIKKLIYKTIKKNNPSTLHLVLRLRGGKRRKDDSKGSGKTELTPVQLKEQERIRLYQIEEAEKLYLKNYSITCVTAEELKEQERIILEERKKREIHDIEQQILQLQSKLSTLKN